MVHWEKIVAIPREVPGSSPGARLFKSEMQWKIVRHSSFPPLRFARFDRDRRRRVLYSGNPENIRSQERGEAMPGAETSWKQLGHWAEARARSRMPCSPRAGRLGFSHLQASARLSPGSERPTKTARIQTLPFTHRLLRPDLL
ncbi:hypothetical protein PMIN07_007368 [Paraphaeosphaeria minitans]